MSKYEAPGFGKKAFHCPCCGTFSQQDWSQLDFILFKPPTGRISKLSVNEKELKLSRCTLCRKYSVWARMQLVHPDCAPEMNEDLDEDTRREYLEAKTIANRSPRAAAALLRLAIVRLCARLGKTGKGIGADLEAMAAEGLPAEIGKALRVVRLTGRDAVRPGEIDGRDTSATVGALFEIISILAQSMITEKKLLERLDRSLSGGGADKELQSPLIPTNGRPRDEQYEPY